MTGSPYAPSNGLTREKVACFMVYFGPYVAGFVGMEMFDREWIVDTMIFGVLGIGIWLTQGWLRWVAVLTWITMGSFHGKPAAMYAYFGGFVITNLANRFPKRDKDGWRA